MEAPASPAPLFHRLANAVVDPAVFDYWAGWINPLWRWAEPVARVVDRRPAGGGAVTLTLQANRHVGTFLPGQHVNVGAEINGRLITRSYSLTGLPRADRRLEITVQPVQGGLMSTHLCAPARVGDVLRVSPAFGDMVLPAPTAWAPADRLVFLAAGSGITPFVGLARALAAQDMPVALDVIVWARSTEQLMRVDDLRALAAQHPRLRVQVVLTGPVRADVQAAGATSGHAGQPAPHGRLSAELLPKLLPEQTDETGHAQANWSNTTVLACGPAGFVATARTLLQPLARSFHAEAFTPQVLADAPAADAPPVQVQLLRSGRTLSILPGEALLPALEAQGITPPSGCRMGICRTCICTRVSGTTLASDTGERDAEPGVPLRLCVSHACTDLSLDL